MTRTMGRPLKFTDDIVDKALTYVYVSDHGESGVCAGFTLDGSVIPTVEGLASYLSVSRDTVYDWCNLPAKPESTEEDSEEWEARIERHKNFSDIVSELKNQQATMLINESLRGKYNATIAKLILSGKHGYVEKSEIDQRVSGELKTGEPNPALAKEFAEYLKGKTK